MSDLFVLAADVETELVERRSRFLTRLHRVTSVEQAEERIRAARTDHPDARHHCTALVIGATFDAAPVHRSSDDGEPSGTAGMPMLQALLHADLTDTLAVVIRYFGGVKLGAGGLVHAYSESVSQALEAVPRAEKSLRELVAVDLPHADAGRIEAELRTHGIDVVDVTYGAHASYRLAIAPGTRDEFDELLAAVTQGNATAREAGTMWVERAR